MTSKSHSGWIVHFAGAPITWASKMQTITAVSTTKTEFISLSTSLREVIPLMGILTEAREQGLQVDYLPPRIHCTVFEDNSSALELAHFPKLHPQTKHINKSFHRFHEHVEHQEIMIKATLVENPQFPIVFNFSCAFFKSKTTCLHVSFTPYEYFYKLSKSASFSRWLLHPVTQKNQ